MFMKSMKIIVLTYDEFSYNYQCRDMIDLPITKNKKKLV